MATPLFSESEQTALDWLRQNTKATLDPSNVSKNIATSLDPFNMYMFMYNAKHKDTLPYWDVYPLIFLWKGVKKGYFTGVNFHYLPPKLRAFLLDLLREGGNVQTISKVIKINPFKFAIKKYILKRTRTRFYRPPASDWNNALFLPVAKFVTGPNSKRYAISKVWKDARGTI